MKKIAFYLILVMSLGANHYSLSKSLDLSNYVTKASINDSVRISLYTPTMFRIRISHFPLKNRFPEKYEIPFLIGKLENWDPVEYSSVKKKNSTEIYTAKLTIVISNSGKEFKVFTHDRKEIYPSHGPIYGMFRDGYTMFDNASAFGQMNSNSRFTHWFYSPLTEDYKNIFLKEDLIEDRYFIFGPDYKSLFKQFNELAGPEPLLPIKEYGFSQTQHLTCSGSQEKLLKVAKKFRDLDIPCDNLIIDFEWGDGCDGSREVKWGKLDWSSHYLKPLSPKQMLDSLHAMHFNVMLIHHSAPDFPGRFGQGWTEQVYPWDTWWSKLKGKLESGIDGVWQDTRRNDITDAAIWKELEKLSGGNRPFFIGCRKMQAVNPWDAYFCAFPMNSIIGSRRYPFVWTGDCSYSWMELAWQIKAITNTFGSMQGISYISSDGFSANWKIQARWNQFSALSAVARSHNPKPWTSDFNTDGFIEKIRITGRDTVKISDNKSKNETAVPQLLRSEKRYLKLRYRLLPYIYSTAYENYKTGIPICRPMLLAFPEDYKCSGDQWPYQYMLGKYLLIAPVYGDFNTMEIYLPSGSQWIDFQDNEIYRGGQIIRYDTEDVTKLPMFVKNGAIIPQTKVRNWIDPDVIENEIIVDIYPDTMPSHFIMYEDDGATNMYQKGRFCTTRFKCSKENNSEAVKFIINSAMGDLSFIPAERVYILNFKRLKARPQKVFINGKKILKAVRLSNKKKESCWVYNEKKSYVKIKFVAKVSVKSVISILR